MLLEREHEVASLVWVAVVRSCDDVLLFECELARFRVCSASLGQVSVHVVVESPDCEHTKLSLVRCPQVRVLDRHIYGGREGKCLS